jgi:hypothetical protein
MRLRGLLTVLVWVLALGAVAGLCAAAYRVHQQSVAHRAEEAGPPDAPKRSTNKVVKLGATLAESHGIEDEPAAAVDWVRRVPAYGRVVPNPRAAAEVRAAFAGILRAAPGTTWPTLGASIKSGQVLGYVDVRVGPQERLDLVTKLSGARAKLPGAEEAVRLTREREDRLKSAGGGGVSQSELDMARRDHNEALTQLAAAKAEVKVWEDALEAISRDDRKDTTWSQPLAAPAAGEVVDLTGRPGTALEPGGLVAKLVDFRYALVRLELPPEALAPAPPAGVDLVATAALPPALEGASNRSSPESPAPYLTARLVGAAPQVEVNSQFAAYWYEADTASETAAGRPGVWRPGLFVTAAVKTGGMPTKAVAVPESALLYHQGRALTYVRVAPGRFERREVEVLGRDGGRWVLAAGVEPGERVVSRRAQVLLSEEFRSDVDND